MNEEQRKEWMKETATLTPERRQAVEDTSKRFVDEMALASKGQEKEIPSFTIKISIPEIGQEKEIVYEGMDAGMVRAMVGGSNKEPIKVVEALIQREKARFAIQALGALIRA